ncbi:MAG: phage major capsid protein [Oscillospiraceae bacterium]|jgi:HK97 family phage major capsid protein|nr:phage major capsid protein [Oscillospiraceae bacterium]
MDIIKRMEEILARKLEIRGLLDAADAETLKSYITELEALDTENRSLEELQKQREKAKAELRNTPTAGTPVVNPVIDNIKTENRNAPGEVKTRAAHIAGLVGVSEADIETRAAEFAKTQKMIIGTDATRRSITLVTDGLAKPTQASGITEGKNQVSGIVDMVNVVNSEGMGQDGVSYEILGTNATVKKDGTAATSSNPTFGTAVISPVLVATVSYISKFIEKTTPLNYMERVSKSAFNALRKKVAKMIVSGDPTATPNPEICGIIKADAITDASTLGITAITAKTLREIALNYGGDENLEGDCVLILNKRDLIAFGDIRGTNEKKAVYEIEFSEGSSTIGVIKDGGLAVKFVINSECKALSDTTTAVGDTTMIYGKSLSYQLSLFSPYSVEVSRDYKFAEGLLAVLGECLVGGNVIAHNGFTLIKKEAGK